MERAGAAGRITWLGHQNSEQLAELYRRATVFVMPSYYETFGISCLEAMAFKVPVVATRAGALPEVIEHDRVGLTVEPGDPAALASAICRLLAEPELRQRLGTAGRERVLSRYTAAAVRDQMVAAYQQAREVVQ
jgi:glycosyltransferase involved in cell wall biosynthesis